MIIAENNAAYLSGVTKKNAFKKPYGWFCYQKWKINQQQLHVLSQLHDNFLQTDKKTHNAASATGRKYTYLSMQGLGMCTIFSKTRHTNHHCKEKYFFLNSEVALQSMTFEESVDNRLQDSGATNAFTNIRSNAKFHAFAKFCLNAR